MRKEQALTDWDKLAETGWQEMRKMLLQSTPSIDIPLVTVLKKRNYFIVISVCLLIILLNIFPAYLYDSPVIPFTPLNKGLAILKPISLTPPIIINKSNHNKENTVIYREKSSISAIAASSATLSKQETFAPISSLDFDNLINLIDTINTRYILTADNNSIVRPNSANVSMAVKRNPFLKRVHIFGGAGINLPAQIANPGSLSWSDINIHPSVTAIIPLSKKFSLHTGIHAMSTIHQRGVTVKNEERVNILGGTSYNINTTSIIKVSYFDVPLALHYSINHLWTIGGGIQLSKFYKLNIREEKKSYDFNNRVISTTAQQYFVNAGQMGVSPAQETINIKRYDARLMAEVSLHKSRWLFSVGYYYGTKKNIKLKETSGQYHQYRNQYLKLGVEYQLHKK